MKLHSVSFTSFHSKNLDFLLISQHSLWFPGLTFSSGMDSESTDSSRPAIDSFIKPTAPPVSEKDGPGPESSLLRSASGISSWAQNLKIPQSLPIPPGDSPNSAISAFSRISTSLGLRSPPAQEGVDSTTSNPSSNVLESLTKGLVDSSRSAVKAVQVKARHMVSQNKRRYQVA